MKADRFLKYADGSCDLTANIKVTFILSTSIIIREVAFQVYYLEKKVTKKSIQTAIKSNLETSGSLYYDYHTEKLGLNKGLSEEEQYEAARPLAEKLFPDFFEITTHMRDEGVSRIADC